MGHVKERLKEFFRDPGVWVFAGAGVFWGFVIYLLY